MRPLSKAFTNVAAMQNLPLTGLVDRRILLNIRANPAVVGSLLPPPFRPQLIKGQAMVGICSIRLRNQRLRGLPQFLGLTSENGAHRYAVEWDADGQTQHGVFFPRRDTSSRINWLVGNRFLGIHYHSIFQVNEDVGNYAVALRNEGGTSLTMEAQETTVWPDTSVFATLEEASALFQRGAIGYSPQTDGTGFCGVKLSTSNWQVSALDVHHVTSGGFFK